MELWRNWWKMVERLRPACGRTRTFLWLAVCLAGMTVRRDLLGVTSIVRALGLAENSYDRILDFFHSPALDLKKLTQAWVRAVFQTHPRLLRINGRPVLVGDGIKVGKSGKKMPGVKLLHQESESNTKPEYIMGHSCQAVAVLAQALKSVFAIPLAGRIHEGVVFSNRDQRTLLDKMVALVESMLALQRRQQSAHTPQEKEMLARQIESTDGQIDRLVYQLYGLSEEEIKIVEGEGWESGPAEVESE